MNYPYNNFNSPNYFPNNFNGMNNYQNYPVPQRLEVIRVEGENGVDALQMMPNCEALLMDKTKPVVWWVQTDGAGFKTKTPFSLSPYQPEPEVDMKMLLNKINELEEKINARSEPTETE